MARSVAQYIAEASEKKECNLNASAKIYISDAQIKSYMEWMYADIVQECGVCVRCALHIQSIDAVKCSSSACHQKYDKCKKTKEYRDTDDGQLHLSPQDHALK